MKKGVYIKQWLAFKPYYDQVNTDFYYLSLCQKVYSILDRNLSKVHWDPRFGEKEQLLVELACFLTSYVEDLASDTKLWLTFVKIHEEHYDQILPIVEVGEDYILGEPNYEDIVLLIWYFVNSIQDQIVFSENEVWLRNAAKDIFEVFVEQWESTPDNTVLQAFYTIDPTIDQFESVHKLMGKILLNSYLFFPDTKIVFEERLKQNLKSKINLDVMNWEAECNIVHNQPTRLLCLYANDWLAAILGIQHPLYGSVKNMSRRISGVFRVESISIDQVQLIHLASDNKFSLNIASIHPDHLNHFVEGQHVMMSIVKWKNDWRINGPYRFIQKDDPSIQRESENVLQGRFVASLLDLNWRSEHVKQGQSLWLKVNADKDLAVGSSTDLITLLDRYIDAVEGHDDELFRQITKQRVAVLRNVLQAHAPTNPKATLLYTTEMGLELSLGTTDAFPIINKDEVDLSQSGIQFLQMLTDPTVSKQKVLYCIQHFRHDIPYFQSPDGITILKNLDFLLRFWKHNQYYSVAL